MPTTLDTEATMEQILKAYSKEEGEEIMRALELPENYVICITLMPKESGEPVTQKKRDPQIVKIVDKARSELARRKTEGYTTEQAAENLTKIRNRIVEKYC